MEKGNLVFGIIIFLIFASIIIYTAFGYAILTLIRAQGEVSPQVYQEEVVDEEYEDSICECR